MEKIYPAQHCGRDPVKELVLCKLKGGFHTSSLGVGITSLPLLTFYRVSRYDTIITLLLSRVFQVFHAQDILSGYRHPRSSATDCIYSAFQMTNETLNIWTHFLAAWYFLWKLLVLLYVPDVWNDPFSWPLLAYLVTCCIYPLTSSIAHTFSTMSSRAMHICYFFDYGALTLYSLGSAVAYSAYVFPEEWLGSLFHQHYVSIAVLNTVIGTTLSCYSRFVEMERPRFSKVIRTIAFAYPYVYDSIPLFYRLYSCTARGCMENAIPVHFLHMVFAWLTCFLFVTHLPERLAPGYFDYFGHSHQLFHVSASTGTYFQTEALLVDMRSRREPLLASSPAPSFAQTFWPVLVSAIISSVIIAAFSTTLYSWPKRSRKRGQRRH